VQLGVTYPQRIIEDLAAARRITVLFCVTLLRMIVAAMVCALFVTLFEGRVAAWCAASCDAVERLEWLWLDRSAVGLHNESVHKGGV
jgi:hypothetical protein